MKSLENDSIVDLHTVEFYNFAPRAISHMKCNKTAGLLAVARSDNSIEIWNVVSEAPVLIKVLYSKSNHLTEGLAWVQGQLFSINNDGQLLQWDLDDLEVKKTMRVTGSTALCIGTTTDEDMIVVGTEDGYINLFSVTEENGVLYNKIMDKQEGHVVCVGFDQSSKVLATGGVENVRIWNTASGHVIHKMTVPRTEAKKEAIVWCLTFIKDMRIISGDSTGRLIIWDAKLGVHLTSILAAKVDILTLTVTDDLKTLFCSGVDPDIKEYSEITVRKETQSTQQWVRVKGRAIHSHDVHDLVWYNKRLFSGGQDGFLTVSSYPPKIVNKYGPFLSPSTATISQAKRLILLKYSNYLEIWRLGVIQETNDNTSDEITLKDSPKKLLELNSKHRKSLIDAKISPDGNWIIYSTPFHVKIFYFETNTGEKPNLKPIEDPKEMIGAQQFIFNNSSDKMFVTKTNRTIQIFELDSNTWVYKQFIDVSQQIQGSIRQLELSTCLNYLSCLSSSNEIVLYQLKNKWKHLLNLPKYDHCPTSFGFRPASKSIVVAFADQKVYEYNFKDMKFILSCNADCGNLRHPITGIVFDPRKSDVIFLQTETGIHLLRHIQNDDENQEIESIIQIKKNKNPNERRDVDGKTIIKTIKEYEHLTYLSWLGKRELLTVNTNTLQLIEQLPPALRQKKFGVS